MLAAKHGTLLTDELLCVHGVQIKTAWIVSELNKNIIFASMRRIVAEIRLDTIRKAGEKVLKKFKCRDGSEGVSVKIVLMEHERDEFNKDYSISIWKPKERMEEKTIWIGNGSNLAKRGDQENGDNDPAFMHDDDIPPI